MHIRVSHDLWEPRASYLVGPRRAFAVLASQSYAVVTDRGRGKLEGNHRVAARTLVDYSRYGLRARADVVAPLFAEWVALVGEWGRFPPLWKRAWDGCHYRLYVCPRESSPFLGRTERCLGGLKRNSRNEL